MATTAERLRLYKKELKKADKPHRFNRYAFIFNSFYFVRRNMPGAFLLWFTLGWFFGLIGERLTEHWGGFLAGWLLVHLAAGFAAPYFVRRHLEWFVKTYDKVKFNATAEYLPIRPRRLVILGLVSGGWYLLYWMYKNWCAIKKATKEPMWPLARGYLFPSFFIYLLLQHIRRHYEKHYPDGKKLQPVILGLMWTAIVSFLMLGVAQSLLQQFAFMPALICLICGILLSLAAIVLLIPVQQAANACNAQTKPKLELRRSFSWGEIVVSVVGIVMTILALAGPSGTAQLRQSALIRLSAETQVKVGQALGEAYRGIYGYAAVCAENGHPLEYFPAEFVRSAAPELQLLDDFFALDGMNLDMAFNVFIPQDNRKEINRILYNELKLMSAPGDSGIGSACAFLDNNATEVSESMTESARPFYLELFEQIKQEL